MGIARPLKTHDQLKTVDASTQIDEPALIEVGDEAFEQSSTNAFLRSFDDLFWEGRTTWFDEYLISTGMTPAQHRLFIARLGLFEAKREKIWDDLVEIQERFPVSVPKARKLLEQNPSIDPNGDFENPNVDYIVNTILLARKWMIDESWLFDDPDINDLTILHKKGN